MAIKVKKKQTQTEVAKAPDTIYTQGSSLFNWLETNRKAVIIGIVVVLVAIAVIATIATQVSRGGQEEGATVTEAVLLANAPVGPDAEGERTFETREERAQAVREAVTDMPAETAGAATLLDATSSVALEDLPRAQERFEAVALREDLPLLSAVAVQGWAATQAEAGQFDAAQATLDQLATRAEGMSDYVELEKARLAEAAGQLELAYRLYNGVAERAGAGLPPMLGGSGSLAEVARHRASVLAVLTGQTEGTGAPDDTAPQGTN